MDTQCKSPTGGDNMSYLNSVALVVIPANFAGASLRSVERKACMHRAEEHKLAAAPTACRGEVLTWHAIATL